MSIALEIRDGNPWWLSFDIWTVPGNDPDGAEGIPIVGTPCYVWARVSNTGTSRVENATVRFYWANPNVGFDRTTATPIGTAFVTLNGGEAQEVLCLTAWLPSFVNGGHECLLVEAFHTSLDPLPSSPAFDVTTDRHVAQRNLNVLAAQGTMMFSAPFEVHNTTSREQSYSLKVQIADDEQFATVANVMRHRDLSHGAAKPKNVGFVVADTPCLCDQHVSGKHSLERLDVPAGGTVGVLLVGEVGDKPSLVHVVQSLGEREVGGASFLLMPHKEGKGHEHARHS